MLPLALLITLRSNVGHPSHLFSVGSQPIPLIIRSLPPPPPSSSFSIPNTDGHSGDAAVNYVTTHVLTETEAGLASGADPVDALPGIFQRLADGLYRALTESEELVVDKLRAGTTATLALLSPTRVIVANVGDSRGVLCRGGQAVPLTRQHRPDDPEELDRIMAAGGRVTFVGVPRVDGQLAMTRAIGAFHLADQGVIAEPDVSVHTIDASQDAFLVLGTDGLFDVVRDEEVVATVMACDSVSEAASALSELALAYGTRDNVTAMVVALPAWDELFAVPEVASRNYARRAN